MRPAASFLPPTSFSDPGSQLRQHGGKSVRLPRFPPETICMIGRLGSPLDKAAMAGVDSSVRQGMNRSRWVLAALAAACCTGAAPTLGEAPLKLRLPIDCTLGSTCFIQNLVDLEAGPAASDFMCGSRTYDGHDGIDFRLPSLARQRQGVAVLAAAAGTVLRLRDGVPDKSVREQGAGALTDRARNGVMIDMAAAGKPIWTWPGSIAVAQGQRSRRAPRSAGRMVSKTIPHLTYLRRAPDGEPFALRPLPQMGGRRLWIADGRPRVQGGRVITRASRRVR